MSQSIQTTSNSSLGSSSNTAVDDPWPRRGREVTTALLALIVVAGTLVLIAKAFAFVSVDDTKDQSFRHAKDLLNIVLPLLGVVLGYYFNKASTETRAETAEKSVQTATVAAHQANEARRDAEFQIERTKESLSEVSNAAERLLGTQAAALETLGADSSADSAVHITELKAALNRAKRYL